MDLNATSKSNSQAIKIQQTQSQQQQQQIQSQNQQQNQSSTTSQKQDKLFKINNQNQSSPRYNISKPKSLNSVAKKFLLARIDEENIQFSKRLQSQSSVIKKDQQDKFFSQTQQWGQMIKRFHILKLNVPKLPSGLKFHNGLSNSNLSNEVLESKFLAKIEFNDITYSEENQKKISQGNKYFLEVKASVNQKRRTLPVQYNNFLKSQTQDTIQVKQLLTNKFIYVGLWLIHDDDGEEQFLGDFEVDLEPFIQKNQKINLTKELINYKDIDKWSNFFNKDKKINGNIDFTLIIEMIKNKIIADKDLKIIWINKDIKSQQNQQYLADQEFQDFIQDKDFSTNQNIKDIKQQFDCKQALILIVNQEAALEIANYVQNDTQQKDFYLDNQQLQMVIFPPSDYKLNEQQQTELDNLIKGQICTIANTFDEVKKQIKEQVNKIRKMRKDYLDQRIKNIVRSEKKMEQLLNNEYLEKNKDLKKIVINPKQLELTNNEQLNAAVVLANEQIYKTNIQINSIQVGQGQGEAQVIGSDGNTYKIQFDNNSQKAQIQLKQGTFTDLTQYSIIKSEIINNNKKETVHYLYPGMQPIVIINDQEKLEYINPQSKETQNVSKLNNDKLKEIKNNIVQKDDALINIELVFVQDVTGSMDSYIASCKQCCENIVKETKSVFQSQNDNKKEKINLRYGLVTFSSHDFYDDGKGGKQPTKLVDFTDPEKMIDYITLMESGGGEGEGEALLEGLVEAKKLSWNKNQQSATIKIIILLTDEIPNNTQFLGYDKCECNINFEQDIASFIKLNQINFNFVKTNESHQQKAADIFKESLGNLYEDVLLESSGQLTEKIVKMIKQKMGLDE